MSKLTLHALTSHSGTLTIERTLKYDLLNKCLSNMHFRTHLHRWVSEDCVTFGYKHYCWNQEGSQNETTCVQNKFWFDVDAVTEICDLQLIVSCFVLLFLSEPGQGLGLQYLLQISFLMWQFDSGLIRNTLEELMKESTSCFTLKIKIEVALVSCLCKHLLRWSIYILHHFNTQ